MSEFVDRYWWGIVLILIIGWTFLLGPATPNRQQWRGGVRLPQSRGR